MVKWIIVLWEPEGACAEEWQARLRSDLPTALMALGAGQVRLNLPDAIAAKGVALRQVHSGALPDAIVQLWFDEDAAMAADALSRLLGEHASRWSGWAVEERVVLDEADRSRRYGERADGWTQMALLRRPPTMPYDDWLDAWQGQHTAVAVETQATFFYVQNRVLHPLGDDRSDVAAIVEEGFPEAALTDPLVFFDAEGDPGRFRANLARMMASCNRFIVPGSIDVMPTGKYEYRRS